jgi:hypothetical protein
MNKAYLLIFTAAIFSLTACSKENDPLNPKPVVEANAVEENKETNGSEMVTKEEEEKEKAGLEEEPAEVIESEESTPKTPEEKEYLTDNHYFVASELANMSENEVREMWGDPVRIEKIKFRYSGTTTFVPASVHYYEDEKYAVTFVEGKAARLVFTLDVDIPYEEEKVKALELAGLPTDVEETMETDTATVWNNLGGVYEVKSFLKGGMVDYLYIVLDEAYK